MLPDMTKEENSIFQEAFFFSRKKNECENNNASNSNYQFVGNKGNGGSF